MCFTSIDVADISPGKIFAKHKVISEGSDLSVKCSPFGSQKTFQHYLYLCKDGLEFMKKRQKQGEIDIIFTIQSVNLYHSGSYSCVYSPRDYSTSQVAMLGLNSIEILVVGKCLFPADRICVEWQM